METTVRESLRELAASELRALLARRRISAAELARRLGWKQSYIARRIDGRVALDLDDLEAIAGLLEIPVADLLPREIDGEEGPEHKIRFAPLAARPIDNRPPGGPRKRDDRDGARRPVRIGNPSPATTTRRAA